MAVDRAQAPGPGGLAALPPGAQFFPRLQVEAPVGAGAPMAGAEPGQPPTHRIGQEGPVRSTSEGFKAQGGVEGDRAADVRDGNGVVASEGSFHGRPRLLTAKGDWLDPKPGLADLGARPALLAVGRPPGAVLRASFSGASWSHRWQGRRAGAARVGFGPWPPGWPDRGPPQRSPRRRNAVAAR